ncbi:MAG TPA: hypothetical protein VHN15_03425, partial [Thermoanaerobaculia bacterium]|nr:hypothetical protein [Thermoanaerobaculia bacterium]
MPTEETLTEADPSPSSVSGLSTSLPWAWREYESFRPLSARVVETRAGEQLVQVCSTQYLGVPW